MTTSSSENSPLLKGPPVSRRQQELSRVIDEITAMCDELEPGSRLPTHTELMTRCDASARTVLNALSELQRLGRIVRRNGLGTFVKERLNEITERPRFSTKAEERIIVAVAIPDRSFYDRAMELLYDHAVTAGLDLVCRFLRPETVIDTLMPYPGNPVGYIISGSKLLPLALKLHSQGHRVVHLGLNAGDDDYPFPVICSDHEQGGYISAKHLIQLGHSRLLYLHIFPGAAGAFRMKGIMRAIAEAGKVGRTISVVTPDHDTFERWRVDPDATRAYFRRADAPTGVDVWNDTLALMFLGALKLAGIEVPTELSIVGYDDIPQAEMSVPKLTTVDGALHQQLGAAVGLLTAPRQAKSTKVIVMPSLVIRGSTSSPPYRSA